MDLLSGGGETTAKGGRRPSKGGRAEDTTSLWSSQFSDNWPYLTLCAASRKYRWKRRVVRGRAARVLGTHCRQLPRKDAQSRIRITQAVSGYPTTFRSGCCTRFRTEQGMGMPPKWPGPACGVLHASPWCPMAYPQPPMPICAQPGRLRSSERTSVPGPDAVSQALGTDVQPRRANRIRPAGRQNGSDSRKVAVKVTLPPGLPPRPVPGARRNGAALQRAG